jgi:OmpA-OmpF porin, OOP family
MIWHRRAHSVRVSAFLIGLAGLALSALPAHGQFVPQPPLPGRFPNGLVVPASYGAATDNADWLAADVMTKGEVVATDSYVGCSEPAGCGPDQCWYIMLSGAVQSRADVSEVGDPATFLLFDDGFDINVALGHQFDLFRLDFEYSYFNNQVETAGAGIPGIGNFVSDAVGNVSVKAYTLNSYFDYQINQSRFSPYVGGGIGLMQSEINSLFPSFFTQIGQTFNGVNTTSNVKFCYQFRVGLNYELSYRTELFSGYRYFDAGELTFASSPFGVFHPDRATFHSFETGIRVKF